MRLFNNRVELRSRTRSWHATRPSGRGRTVRPSCRFAKRTCWCWPTRGCGSGRPSFSGIWWSEDIQRRIRRATMRRCLYAAVPEGNSVLKSCLICNVIEMWGEWGGMRYGEAPNSILCFGGSTYVVRLHVVFLNLWAMSLF